MPPPKPDPAKPEPARLPLMVLSIIVSGPAPMIPPPSKTAVLLVIVLWMIVASCQRADSAAVPAGKPKVKPAQLSADNAIDEGQRSGVIDAAAAGSSVADVSGHDAIADRQCRLRRYRSPPPNDWRCRY